MNTVIVIDDEANPVLIIYESYKRNEYHGFVLFRSAMHVWLYNVANVCCLESTIRFTNEYN